MAIDFKALGAKAAATGTNMTVASAGGGGDYEPPAKGPTRLRFVSYVELGKQAGSYLGKPTLKEKVELVFELSGKNHQPKVLDDGTKIPHRVSIELNFSLNEKAALFKLFQRLNYKQEATHIAQLLGQPYKGEVFHREYKRKDGKVGIAAELDSKEAGFSIAPPRVEDDEVEGGWRVLEVAPAITPIKCFLWDHADMEQWSSIFVEGEYPERKDDKGVVTAKAKSKNVLQNKIKGASNFVGSPMHELLVSSGQPLDIPAMDEQDDEAPESQETAKTFSPELAPTAAKPAAPDALGDIV
jgi:hypothetical protein